MKKFIELIAVMLIGDSVLSMLSPKRHISLWAEGPRWWKRVCEPFARHSDVTRVLGAAGLGFGLWLAWRQEPQPRRSRNGFGGRLKEVLQ